MSVFDPELAVKAMLPKELAAKSTSLHLAIHIHPEMVEVMVFDYDSNEVLWLEAFDVEGNSAEAFRDAVDFVTLKNWGDRVFRKTSISFDHPDFTLIPQGFVVPGKEGELLNFSTMRTAENPEISAIHEVGAALVYDLPHVVKGLTARFPNAKFYSSCGFFLKEVVKSALHKDGFHALVQKGFLLVIACAKGEIKLTNHYGIQGQDDVLYHIANAAMRLDMHLPSSSLTLYGDSASEDLKDLLDRYIGTVDFWTRPSDIRGLKNGEDHELYSVLIHAICG